jgi:hypothetical protein
VARAYVRIMVYSYPEWHLYENKILPPPHFFKKKMIGNKKFFIRCLTPLISVKMFKNCYVNICDKIRNILLAEQPSKTIWHLRTAYIYIYIHYIRVWIRVRVYMYIYIPVCVWLCVIYCLYPRLFSNNESCSTFNGWSIFNNLPQK